MYLHVNRDTLYEWEKANKEFSDIMGELRAIQADRLVNKGLSGDYNPTIAKVLLTKHGYRDSQEVTGAEGSPLFDITNRDKANEAIKDILGTEAPE